MGELILGRKDDGTLEIVRADDEVEISDEVIESLPTQAQNRTYYLDGEKLRVEATNGLLVYMLTEHDDRRGVWRAVRTETTGG